MPDFNIPDPSDPDFSSKMSRLMRSVYDVLEKDTKDFKPIEDPEEGLQVGSVWFDTNTGKLKINTSAGVKTLQFEP